MPTTYSNSGTGGQPRTWDLTIPSLTVRPPLAVTCPVYCVGQLRVLAFELLLLFLETPLARLYIDQRLINPIRLRKSPQSTPP